MISPFSAMFSISWALVLPLDRQAILKYKRVFGRGFGVSTVIFRYQTGRACLFDMRDKVEMRYGKLDGHE